MVDHRASPGLPPDIAKAAGYDPAQCQEGKLFEAASLTCAHCKVAVVKNHLRVRPREYCPKCDHYICDICHFKSTLSDYSHFPYDKLVDLTLAGKDPMTMGSPMGLILTSPVNDLI